MRKRIVSTKLIRTVERLKATNTYAQTAKKLSAQGFKTPQGRKPTVQFVNYIVSTYC